MLGSCHVTLFTKALYIGVMARSVDSDVVLGFCDNDTARLLLETVQPGNFVLRRRRKLEL